MSELSSFAQRSSRAVLSSGDLAAIQRRVGIAEAQPGGPAIDFELHPGGPVFGVVPIQAFPSEWPSWPLPAEATGVGLCFPVDGAGHLGVAMNRRGDATWFSIADGWAWGDTPPACQLLDDVCRLRLGLSTPEPDRSPDWYWLERWLVDIVNDAFEAAVALERSGAADLVDVLTVATHHPAVEFEDVRGLDLNGLAGFVVERHRTHVEIADWECIRLDAVDDPAHELHQLATALDVGAFSRWVSASAPPLSDLASALTSSCSALGLRLVGAVISDIVLRHRLSGA